MQPGEPDHAIHDFAQAIGLLVRRVRAAAQSERLSLSEGAVLRRLAKSGPATTADLARAEGMRPQSMRPIVASLEQSEMIRRVSHPTDGRQVLLELTARGQAEQSELTDAKLAWITHAFARLNEHERATLLTAGPIMRHLAQLEPGR